MFKLIVVLACVCAVYGGAVLPYAYTHAALPAVTYAAAAPVVAAPVAVVDPTHFSYGYLQPFGNGHVEVARNGPVEAHSYSFNSGNVFP